MNYENIEAAIQEAPGGYIYQICLRHVSRLVLKNACGVLVGSVLSQKDSNGKYGAHWRNGHESNPH